MNARDGNESINHLKLPHYDKERNRKIHRAAYRIDCIGDTDGTGGYLVHGGISPSKKKEPEA